MFGDREKLFRAVLIVNAAITLLLTALLVCVAITPETFFPGAFAEKGERGDKGPRGDRGPRGRLGPMGPPGPGVEEALAEIKELRIWTDEIEMTASDLDDRVGQLEAEVSSAASDADQALSMAEDACSDLRDLAWSFDDILDWMPSC